MHAQAFQEGMWLMYMVTYRQASIGRSMNGASNYAGLFQSKRRTVQGTVIEDLSIRISHAACVRALPCKLRRLTLKPLYIIVHLDFTPS